MTINPIDIAVMLGAFVTVCLLLTPKVSGSRLWRATTTPLASIIGSGFLVLGPLLFYSFGRLACVAMAVLCLAAYAFGSIVRFNIASLQAIGPAKRPRGEKRVDLASSWMLAFAYIVSVAYYLNLFGSFAVSLTPWDGPVIARCVTSAVFFYVLVVGWTRGFHALEGLERISVGIKLCIIAGLLVGLVWYAAGRLETTQWVPAPVNVSGWAALTLGFGLIVTVQGFETSRYLGPAYDAITRIRSMRLAQWLSTAIYLVYIGFLSLGFDALPQRGSETEIINMMAVVSSLLPFMLVIAALSAQFSAAVADTSGAGGLIFELSGKRLRPRYAYAVLVALGLGLTWLSNVFSIIAYASRAFAAYYAAQAVLGAVTAMRRDGRVSWRVLFCSAMALLGAMIVIFGTAVE